MDDIFTIVYATSLRHAEYLLKEYVKYPGLEVNWEISEIQTVFLDISLWKSPTSPNSPILYKPYRKPMNNFERLPWISGHSDAILKAAFKSEIYRLATNSCNSSIFEDELNWIIRLYTERGYPYKVLSSWTKKFKTTAYARRLKKSVASETESEGVWPLLGEMNPAWEKVALTTVSDAMVDTWLKQGLDVQTVRKVNKRLVAALKRPRNLGDRSNAHNKRLLKINKDADVLFIEPPPPPGPRRNYYRGHPLHIDDDSEMSQVSSE